MRAPKWLKEFKPKTKDRRGRHTKAQRLARLRAARDAITHQTCSGCMAILDPSIRTEEGDAIVCVHCGVVDSNLCFDYEVPVCNSVTKLSLYHHKNYFAEKISQARDKEPRLKDTELDAMSAVYDIYRRHCPLLWAEEMFTKKHAQRICRSIKKAYPHTQWHTRSERWFQYRNYICGNVNNALPETIATKLRILFDAYAYFFLRYLDINKSPKRNITKLDLVILVLLYNLSPSALNDHGWYFLNKNILNKSAATLKDMKEIRAVCELANNNIFTMKEVYLIQPACHKWFRDKNKFVVPKLDSLIDQALNHPMGYYKYTAYIGNNHVALLSTLFTEQNENCNTV